MPSDLAERFVKGSRSNDRRVRPSARRYSAISPVSRRHVIENEAGELPVLTLEVERLEVP